METLFKTKKSNRAGVIISSKSARLLFTDCDKKYVLSVCKGSCCRGSCTDNKRGILNVAIVPREEHFFRKLGVEIKDGFLVPNPGEKKCPFQNEMIDFWPDLVGINIKNEGPHPQCGLRRRRDLPPRAALAVRQP